MIFNDIWGKIEIEDKYIDIVKSKEFNDLKNKNQLGVNSSPNSIHTRYQHSLGVYYLACKLVDICKKKFNGLLDIDYKDEQAIKCMALVHDIGHGPFSHVSEDFIDGTHEMRSVELLLDENSEIHNVIINNFGNEVLDKVIDLITMKERVKSNNNINEDISLMFIVSKLLSGGIDIDRIDYIYRDSKFVLGEINDFSNILNHIEIEYLNDRLEVVFGEDAEYLIANFFNKRYELYDRVYLETKTRILNTMFGLFVNRANIKLDWNTSEIEIKKIIEDKLNDKDEIISRYADILYYKELDKNIIVKEINNENDFEAFKSKLLNLVPILNDYKETIYESSCESSIYSDKNKIYINKNGLIHDIKEVSQILNSELVKEKYVIGIDLKLLKELMLKNNVDKSIINKTIISIKSACSVEIEEEKKYMFKMGICNNLYEVNRGKNEIISSMKLEGENNTINIDTYYDCDDILINEGINVRKRENNGNIEYTIKEKLTDETSITKRKEINYSSKEEIIKYLNSKGYNITHLDELLKLETRRRKFYLECYGGLFEISFDETFPSYKGKMYNPFSMIECELISGSSVGLYYINNYLTKFDFVEECKQSKKDIALSIIKNQEEFLNNYGMLLTLSNKM